MLKIGLDSLFEALVLAQSIDHGTQVEQLYSLLPSRRQLKILGRVAHASVRIRLSESAYWAVGLGKPRELSHLLFYVMVEKYGLAFLFLDPYSPLVSFFTMLSML